MAFWNTPLLLLPHHPSCCACLGGTVFCRLYQTGNIRSPHLVPLPLPETFQSVHTRPPGLQRGEDKTNAKPFPVALFKYPRQSLCGRKQTVRPQSRDMGSPETVKGPVAAP
ncbi:hypothetical protein FOMPIDRAFT_1017894 [Fomitopsis schrenkii]|uniref:Secreted protein n=1 Tax=Fomitopsis schrenkii TaxID=2126942 RepID=S8E0E4_FOMSC|nr:hypothetical protein FOMPIDRAFT_1017894 [Fomitopsis schrenkii]